jgi:hypothetical protein
MVISMTWSPQNGDGAEGARALEILGDLVSRDRSHFISFDNKASAFAHQLR